MNELSSEFVSERTIKTQSVNTHVHT